MSPDPRDPLDRFDDELRRWAARPARRSSSRAAEELRARITERSKRSPALWRWAAVGAVALLVAVLGWRELRGPSQTPEPQIAAREERLDVPPLDPEVALIWLDQDTPLYLTLTPPASGGGDTE